MRRFNTNLHPIMLGCLLLTALTACNTELQSDVRGQSVGYREGTVEDNFTSNSERGNVRITEINWAGSVTDDGVYDPTDVFIEFQNGHPRPIYMTGWQLIIQSGTGRLGQDELAGRNQRPVTTYVVPLRRNGNEPIEPNEFVTIATRADGSVENPDFIIPELKIPRDRFRITLRDIDDRLVGGAGDTHQAIFGGNYDLVNVRSMERVQLIFANQDARESSWHSYGYNPWDEDHAERLSGIREGYKEHTFASPGRANSPDYSGNTAAGDFQ